MNDENKKQDRKRKSKYHDNTKFHHSYKQYLKGGPGVLLTCETGLEKKCLREGLDILTYYCSNDENVNKINSCDDIHDESNDTKKSSTTIVESTPLTLEEEIKLLRKTKNDKSNALFQEYPTNSKGTLFLAYNLKSSSQDDKGSCNSSKKQKTTNPDLESSISDDKSNTIDPSSPKLSSWDPVPIIKQLITDIQTCKPQIPSSRFVTRCIPIQATCFASLQEITETAQNLLLQNMIPHTLDAYLKHYEKNTLNTYNKPSFKIQFKKRSCSHLQRDQVIEAIANLVQRLSNDSIRNSKKLNESPSKDEALDLFRVDLTNPDYAIIVEVSTTFCGISVVANSNFFENFNLIELRNRYKNDNLDKNGEDE